MSLPSEPITRKEQYLAKAAGQSVEIPAEPITREEAYLDAIAKGGGGGGGTSDYSQLTNLPQINGNTLVGNKTASQLGLASTADLEGKVDKAEGYGLSENDYTDADKASVATIAGKQNALTAGDYISIDANNEITVNREIPSVSASYEIKTTSTSDPEINTDVIKRVNGEIVWTQNYNYQTVRDNPVTIDDVFVLSYSGQWKYKLLVASDDHAAGYEQTWGWSAWVDYTENFSLVDNTGKKLIIKSELDTAINAIKDGQSIDSFADVETALAGKQATLTFDDTPTDNSNNPVKSNGIYDALATKQNATDNNLQTTSKTVVGAVNELKNGLTNVEADAKLNTNDLTTPSRTKNVLPMTLSGMKSINSVAGTWSNNVYTRNDVNFTVNTDTNGNVINITANGTASDVTYFYVANNLSYLGTFDGSYKVSGGASGGNPDKYALQIYSETSGIVINCYESNDYTIERAGYTNSHIKSAVIVVRSGVTVSNLVFTPMIRLSSVTDSTFAPYIPSVESRLETAENDLISVDVALALPENTGKNVLPLTVDRIKSSTGGTWDGNTYVKNGITWTILTDSSGNVTGIKATGTATENSQLSISLDKIVPTGNYYFNGCPTGGSDSKYDLYAWDITNDKRAKKWDGTTASVSDFGGTSQEVQVLSDHSQVMTCRVRIGTNLGDGIVFSPMIRPADVTDDSFVPYVPTINVRLSEAEKNLVYSSAETDTGKTWIDGRKIYRKYLTATIAAEQTEGTAEKTTIEVGASVRNYTDFFMVTTTASGVFTPYINVDSNADNTLRVLLRTKDTSTNANRIEVYNFTTTARTANLYVEYTK